MNNYSDNTPKNPRIVRRVVRRSEKPAAPREAVPYERPARGPSTQVNAAVPFELLPIVGHLPPESLALSMLVAGRVVARVKAGQAVNDGLAQVWQAHPELEGGARGAVQDLVFGTLRDFGRGEFLLGKLLQQPLTEASIDGLLLVALHRLEQRPESAYVIVDQAVEAAACISRGGLKGLVNAVLRNAIRRKEELFEACERNGQAHWRHPSWWIEAVRGAHPEHWMQILEAGNDHPPMTLRINPLRTNMEEASEVLREAGHEVVILSEQACRLVKPVPVASLPGYEDGFLSVQDWGAQQAALLMDLKDGQRVLDACSAPGGKSAHILELADVDLLSLDSSASRITRVSDQLQRLGLRGQTRSADCRDVNSWWDGRYFDRILADVPCSASGVVRRHPDIKWLRREEDVASFATVQRQILNALWRLLAPGGKMLYVTCSVFPEENAEQMIQFAARHGDCRRVPLENGMLEEYCLPEPHHDGFFFALLEKMA